MQSEIWVIRRELTSREPRPDPCVVGQQLVDLSLLPCEYDHEVVSVVLHQLHQSVQRLPPKLIPPPLHQGVGLVYTKIRKGHRFS